MRHHIYCDESRQTKDRFMVIGGVLIPSNNVPNVNATIEKFRSETRMIKELKWGKVSRGKLAEYTRFVEYLFALNNAKKIVFSSIILDTNQIDHNTHSGGDKEMGFYKFYYQLLLHSFGFFCKKPDDFFYVHLDYRDTNYSLDTLRVCLNSGIRRKSGFGHNPYKTVEPRDSKQCNLIQMVDVLVGAIGFKKNGYDLMSGASESKIILANLIEKQAGLKNLSDTTGYNQRRFTIWNMRLKSK